MLGYFYETGILQIIEFLYRQSFAYAIFKTLEKHPCKQKTMLLEE